jgi:hypothetical protein
LTILAESRERPEPGRHVRCRCSCGRECLYRLVDLLHGKILSCGCLRAEKAAGRFRTHGLCSHGRKPPEYKSWEHMRHRCERADHKQYPDYGGRGIRVCYRWHDFAAFLSDMGPRPSPKHTLERIDVNGHYEPGNVRWATQKEQQRNKRTTVWVTINGVKRCLADWADLSGLRYQTLHQRLRLGVPPDLLLSPMHKGRRWDFRRVGRTA